MTRCVSRFCRRTAAGLAQAAGTSSPVLTGIAGWGAAPPPPSCTTTYRRPCGVAERRSPRTVAGDPRLLVGGHQVQEDGRAGVAPGGSPPTGAPRGAHSAARTNRHGRQHPGQSIAQLEGRAEIEEQGGEEERSPCTARARPGHVLGSLRASAGGGASFSTRRRACTRPGARGTQHPLDGPAARAPRGDRSMTAGRPERGVARSRRSFSALERLAPRASSADLAAQALQRQHAVSPKTAISARTGARPTTIQPGRVRRVMRRRPPAGGAMRRRLIGGAPGRVAARPARRVSRAPPRSAGAGCTWRCARRGRASRS